MLTPDPSGRWRPASPSPAGFPVGRLREEELPVVRVIVQPDPDGRVFEDDLDPGDLVFDGKLTPMLVWHERYPVGRGWRSGWVLSYDTDGKGEDDRTESFSRVPRESARTRDGAPWSV